jgi:hypothetical protein
MGTHTPTSHLNALSAVVVPLTLRAELAVPLMLFGDGVFRSPPVLALFAMILTNSLTELAWRPGRRGRGAVALAVGWCVNFGVFAVTALWQGPRAGALAAVSICFGCTGPLRAVAAALSLLTARRPSSPGR